jgi:hypothetical protein
VGAAAPQTYADFLCPSCANPVRLDGRAVLREDDQPSVTGIRIQWSTVDPSDL